MPKPVLVISIFFPEDATTFTFAVVYFCGVSVVDTFVGVVFVVVVSGVVISLSVLYVVVPVVTSVSVVTASVFSMCVVSASVLSNIVVVSTETVVGSDVDGAK